MDALEHLTARVRKLEDIEEIRSLRMRYHECINEGMFDRIPEIFTGDAYVELDYVANAKGTEAIREMFLKIPKHLDFVKQFIHNHMVDIQGDVGSGLSYLEARYAAGGESVMVAAQFRDKYVRTSTGWKMSEMFLKLYFSAPLTKGWAGADSHHVKPFR